MRQGLDMGAQEELQSVAYIGSAFDEEGGSVKNKSSVRITLNSCSLTEHSRRPSTIRVMYFNAGVHSGCPAAAA